MIPDIPPSGRGGAKAERLVYEALQAQLSDEFHVYHGLNYVEPGRASEGEADFLVVHRKEGLLAIEVKGLGVLRDHRGRWIRTRPDGTAKRLNRSPFEQVEQHVHDLTVMLKARISATFPEMESRFPFTFGHAVAFPRGRSTELNLPLDVPSQILYDASDLRRLGERVLDTMRFWAADRRTPALEPKQYRRFRRQLLMPAFRVVPNLGAKLYVDARQFVRLTEEQVRALRGALVNRRLLVSGGAGTGKTVTALEVARSFAERGADGGNVLFLCYNRHLAHHLKACVEAMELQRGRIRATHFAGLCYWANCAAGHDPQIPDREDKEAYTRYWEDEAPLELMAAIESGHIPQFDALVVDEAQDLRDGWWPILEDLLADREQCPMVMFYDASQDLFSRGTPLPAGVVRHHLPFNLRNTRRITESVRRLGGVDMEAHPDSPEGEEPVVHLQEGPTKTRRQIEQLVKRLVGNDGVDPEQIVILTPHSREKSSLASCEELAGLRLASDPLDRNGALVHTTIRKFKGLETEVMIFADVDPRDDRCGLADRYVAASRARQVLHVFTRGDWMAGAG